jgi:DNA-binding GntR family transcriptional regulator
MFALGSVRVESGSDRVPSINEPWPVAGTPETAAGGGTIRERVCRVLRDRILTGALPPGSRIDLDAVATEFETSRTPVREACLELAHDGLVRIAPRSGVLVIGLSPDAILENFAVMAVLVGVAAEWAARRITHEELRRVRELKVEVAIAVRSGDDSATVNWLFHREVNKACKSQRLLAMLGMAGRMIPPGFLNSFPEHVPCSLEEHDGLVRALAGHDGAAARKIAEDHLHGAAEVLSARVAQMAPGAGAELS